MSKLIEDLLAFSHISTTDPETGPVELNKIIDDVLATLEINIQHSGATITREPLPSIKGDVTQLAQLFQNLLSNAIKFRRQGIVPQIQVTWQIVKASKIVNAPDLDPKVRVYDRINISDNGIGFDLKHQERIFKVFQRLHSKSEFKGTGVGLAICEKVAASHGGFIKVESQIGIGSMFSVYFPISG